MVSGIKYDHPPLLPPGRHPMTLSQIKDVFVIPFDVRERRLTLFHQLEAFFQEYLVCGVPGEMWLDGSFLTEKPEPADLDISVIIPANGGGSGISDEQRALIDATNDGKFGPALDAFAWEWLEPGHPQFFDEQLNPARTWHEQYGTEHSGKWIKGFVTMRLR